MFHMEKELNENVSEKVEGFIKDHYGRFRKYISDKMLKHLLVVMITDQYDISDGRERLDIIAYNVGCIVFESVLDHRCEAACNGHQVAQDLSNRFK